MVEEHPSLLTDLVMKYGVFVAEEFNERSGDFRTMTHDEKLEIGKLYKIEFLGGESIRFFTLAPTQDMNCVKYNFIYSEAEFLLKQATLRSLSNE